ARDVAGGVRGEEDTGIRDLLGAAETAERNLLELLRSAGRRVTKLRIPLRVAPLRIHGAGDHHVRAYAKGAELRGQRADEAEQPGLRRRHRRRVGPARQARLPADRDDAAVPPLLHAGDDSAREIEGRVQIDAHHSMPVLYGGLGDGRVRADGGVTDEHVDAAQLRRAFVDHLLDRSGVSDVAEYGHDPYPGFPALRGHGFQLVPVDTRVQHQVRALVGEGERDGAADVATGPRDERGPAHEP